MLPSWAPPFGLLAISLWIGILMLYDWGGSEPQEALKKC